MRPEIPITPLRGNVDQAPGGDFGDQQGMAGLQVRTGSGPHGGSQPRGGRGRPPGREVMGRREGRMGGGDPGEGEGLKVQIYCLFTR